MMQMPRRTFLRPAYAVALPLLLAGAAIGQTPSRPTVLPPGPDAQRVSARCTACHGLDYITRQPHGRGTAWWTKTVDDMVDTHGADIPDDEKKAITLFLARVNG